MPDSGQQKESAGNRSILLTIAFHVAAAATLFAAAVHTATVSFVLPLPTRALLPVFGGMAAYCLAALYLEIMARQRMHRPYLKAIVLGLLVYGVYAMTLLLAGGSYSRRTVGLIILAGLILLPLSRAPRWLLTASLLVCLLITAAALRSSRAGPPSQQAHVTKFLATSHEWLDASSYPGRLPSSAASGGALALTGTHYILSLGDGRLFRLHFRGDKDDLEVVPMRTAVPINSSEFAAAVDKSIRTDWFRVADLLVHQTADGPRLFASHHHWKTADRCFVIRVSKLENALDSMPATASDARWSTVFESKPCMPVQATERTSGFWGLELGGSMASFDTTHILLALGHHGFDGVDSPLAVSQDTASDLGKTILLNPGSGSTRRYTLGHRNPQGLTVATDGSIWLTEHGPQGGDELNLLAEFANYGWPFETYGTQYGMRVWPLSRTPGEHEQYRAPIFSWLPSVGVSSVIQSRGQAIPAWRNDLLIGSMPDKSLWRVRIRHGRAVFTERIPLQRRIRDAVEGNDGRILIWTDEHELIALRASTMPARGERFFATECARCHRIGDGNRHEIGPDLRGIIGRRVAVKPDFEYSEALRELGGTKWSEAQLLAFLRDPAQYAPGTSMNYPGLADADAREAIVSFIRSQ